MITMRTSVLIIGAVLIAAAIGIAVAFPTLIVAGGPGQPATVGNLVGYVTNTSSGSGIVGASVVLSVSGSQRYSTSTLSAGYYKFGAITAGGYTISVSASGYQSFQGSTGVSPGTTSSFNAQLAPLGYSGYSGGSGCTPPPTGGGCSVPAPPPGVSPPPPPPTQAPAVNVTTPPPFNQVPVIGGIGNPLAYALLVSGLVLVAVGIVRRRR